MQASKFPKANFQSSTLNHGKQGKFKEKILNMFKTHYDFLIDNRLRNKFTAALNKKAAFFFSREFTKEISHFFLDQCWLEKFFFEVSCLTF